eukprot:GGOE01012996.1.p1 GENE.GGOE01012996.1~~GGOE01012996.1.p1  ORF type:complete len:523 (-),score=81.72 GGOE01012996.1:163-1731(-)
MIAYAGPLIDRNLPRALSLSEYSGWRFGVVAQIGVTLLAILNMSIFMLSEFVTIGTLFGVYVGSVGYPIIIVVGLLTLTYTTFGGLLVSVATDQVQGIISIVLLLVITIYLGVTFDMPLPAMTDTVSGNTQTGLSSIFTMPASIFAGAVFNESLWQRAFAAENKRTLWIGATLGAVGSIVMVFICGLCGWLAVWADPDTVFAANANLYMFYGLKGTVDVTTGTMNNTMGLVVLLLAVIMNEGAIDSLQNGLLASFSSFTSLGIRYYRKSHPEQLPFWCTADYQLPLWCTQILVVLINVPLIVLGSIGCSKGWSIMDLYLVTGMLCCTVCIPVLCGISGRFRSTYGGVSFLLSWIAGFLCPCFYGIFKECWHSDLVYDETLFTWQCVPNESGTGGAGEGMVYTWYRNGYRWEYFLLALGCSSGAMVVCMLVNWLLNHCGVKVPTIPGFRPFYLEDDISDGNGEEIEIAKDTSLTSLNEKEDDEEASLPKDPDADYFDYQYPSHPTSTPELFHPPAQRPVYPIY